MVAPKISRSPFSLRSASANWFVFAVVGGLLTILCQPSAFAQANRQGIQEPHSQAEPSALEEGEVVDPEMKYREGRIIRDRSVTFKVTGDRVELVPSDGHSSLTVLENLTLERVKNELIRVGSTIHWDVTALVTEFEGGNYVLLKRATISSTFGRQEE